MTNRNAFAKFESKTLCRVGYCLAVGLHWCKEDWRQRQSIVLMVTWLFKSLQQVLKYPHSQAGPGNEASAQAYVAADRTLETYVSETSHGKLMNNYWKCCWYFIGRVPTEVVYRVIAHIQTAIQKFLMYGKQTSTQNIPVLILHYLYTYYWRCKAIMASCSEQ